MILLLVSFLHHVTSLVIEQQNVRLKPDKLEHVEFKINKEPFGFIKNANFTITTVCERAVRLDATKPDHPTPTLELYTCPRGVHKVVPSICVLRDTFTYTNLEDNVIHWTGSIESTSFYVFSLKESRNKKTEEKCTISGIFLNPGGRHLSSDEMHISTNTICIIVTWLVISLLWLGNFLRYKKHSNNLHQLLSVIIILKLIYLALEFLYWTDFNNKGQISLRISIPYDVVTGLFHSLLFLLLMLAGEGWCIIWESPRLVKYYSILSSSFFLMFFCYKYLHKYFQGFAIVFASMMGYIAFRCSTICINLTKRNIIASNQFIENHGLTYKSEKTLKKRLTKQLRMFQLLQGLIVGLPCVVIVVESVASFLLVYHKWITVLLIELLQLGTVLYLCALFHLRDFSQYNNIVLNTPYPRVTVLMSPHRSVVYISGGADTETPGGGTER